MNYAELVEAIESTVENEFDTTDIDRIIQLAEHRVYDTVDLPIQRKNLTGTTLTSGNRYYTLPADYRYLYSVAVINSGTYTYLLPKQPDFILEAYPTPATTGVPAHYGFYSETDLIVGPTPGSAYELELNYSYYPESIVTADTTWLGDNFETVLLNACLVEAARFLQEEEDMVRLYQEELAKSLVLIKNLGAGKLQQDAYRSGETRMKVM